jgi:hypothetical protein
MWHMRCGDTVSSSSIKRWVGGWVCVYGPAAAASACSAAGDREHSSIASDIPLAHLSGGSQWQLGPLAWLLSACLLLLTRGDAAEAHACVGVWLCRVVCGTRHYAAPALLIGLSRAKLVVQFSVHHHQCLTQAAGACASAAVAATGTCRGAVEPESWTAAERLRLNFPPHRAPNSQRLRLACQVGTAMAAVCGWDVVVSL